MLHEFSLNSVCAVLHCGACFSYQKCEGWMWASTAVLLFNLALFFHVRACCPS